LPSRVTPDGEPDSLLFGPSGSACAGITALSAITAARANLKARNLSLLKWTVFDAYVTTGHWRRFVPSSRAYSQVILARCGQLEPDLLLSFPGRSGRSPRRRLVLMWPIAMSHPMVMVVMATVRSQKAAPISPISPIRYGRRRCIKPREVFSLDTIGKIRGAGLKPVASTPRLVFTPKLLR